MPLLPSVARRREAERREAAERAAEREMAQDLFEREFMRSRKGNLWRRLDDLHLSVFRHPDGKYRWSIADEDGPHFGIVPYRTEGEALEAVWEHLQAGAW